jgi:prefoldin subunit 5
VVASTLGLGDPHVTRYVFRLAAVLSAVENQRVQHRALPSIKIADIFVSVFVDDSVEAELERATMTRSASQQASTAPDRPSEGSSALAQLWAGMEPTAHASESDRPEPTAATDPTSSAHRDANEDYPSLAEVVQGTDEASPAPEPNPATEGDEETTDAEIDVAGRLLEQLEAGEVSATQREQLADHLADALGTTTPRELSRRMDALETDLSAFEAYLETLDGIIDEHGPPEAFLKEVRERIALLAESMDAIERELEGAAATRTRTVETLEQVDERVERLASRTERLDDRIRSLRKAHRQRAAEIEAGLEEFQPVVDRVDELETELESLAKAVEEIDTRRQAVWRALSEDGTVEK